MRSKLFALSVSVGACLRLTPLITDASDLIEQEQLVGVQVIFRHGARTPVYDLHYDRNVIPDVTWPPNMTDNVPKTMIPYTTCNLDGSPSEVEKRRTYEIELKGGAQGGLLTQRGQEDMYAMGQRLRQRYGRKLNISAAYNSNDVYCRSTSVPRNVASMRCVLAGLFEWSDGAKGDMPAIHVSKSRTENLYPNRGNCPLIFTRLTTLEPIDHPQGMLALREKITKILGPGALQINKKMPDGSKKIRPACLYNLRDEFYSRKYHGLPMSEVGHTLLNEMNAVCGHELAYYTAGVDKNWRMVGLRINVGPFCGQILENISTMISSDSNIRRLHLYSTHDASMVPLLLAMDIFDGQYPPYGADLVIELYEKKDKSRMVQLLYCGKIVAKLTLEDYLKKLKKAAVSPDIYERICNLSAAEALRYSSD